MNYCTWRDKMTGFGSAGYYATQQSINLALETIKLQRNLSLAILGVAASIAGARSVQRNLRKRVDSKADAIKSS